jgi:hypothetical protein
MWGAIAQDTYFIVSSLNGTMKKEQQKEVALSVTIVAYIILLKSLLPWLMNLFGFPMSRPVHMTLFLFFPHEVLGMLKYALLLWTRNYQLYAIPFFSLLFAIFLFIAAAQFSNKQNKRPLGIACVILLISILMSIPETIIFYNKAVIAYNNYKPSSTKEGILGLIEGFVAVRKPSLPLLIGELVILLGYMGWAVWVLNRLYGAKYK